MPCYITNTAKTTAGINHVSPPLLTCEPAAVTTAEGVEVDVPEPTTAGAVVEVPEPEDAKAVEVDVLEPTTAVVEVSDTLVSVAEPETAADDEDAGKGDDSVGSSVVLSDGAAGLVDDDGAGAAGEDVSDVGGTLVAGAEGATELAGGAETSRELVMVPWTPVSVTRAVATGVPSE